MGSLSSDDTSFSKWTPANQLPEALKVAAAHVSPVFMDASESANKAVLWVEKAAASGVDLLVFPETFIPGFPVSRQWDTAAPNMIIASRQN